MQMTRIQWTQCLSDVSVIMDSPNRIMVKSTDRRIRIFQAIAEKNHLDIHSIINSMMLEWVVKNLDDEKLVAPVKEIFNG